MAAQGDGGVDLTEGKLSIQVDAPSIPTLVLNEIGTYSITGAGGTSATQVNNGCLGITAFVTRIDGQSVDGPTITFPISYKLITGPVTYPVDGVLGNVPNTSSLSWPISTPSQGTSWYGGTYIDLAAALNGTPWQGHKVTEATLVLDNVLTTQSESGTVAMGNITPMWITPEPGTIVLVSIGGLGLAAYSWCKRRRSGSSNVA